MLREKDDRKLIRRKIHIMYTLTNKKYIHKTRNTRELILVHTQSNVQRNIY